MRRRSRRVPALRSSFAGFRFPPDVITMAVRWYLRYGLSCRDVEELLAERGINVDHVRGQPRNTDPDYSMKQPFRKPIPLCGHRQLGRRPGDWDDRWIVCVEGRGGLDWWAPVRRCTRGSGFVCHER